MQCGKGIFLREINPITENCGSGMHVSGGGLAFLIYLAVVAVLIIFFFNREDAPSSPEPHEAIVLSLILGSLGLGVAMVFGPILDKLIN